MHSRWARKQIRRVLTLALTATVAIVGLVLLQPPRAELSVLCSNNSESCRTVADAFEERTNHRVHVVRLPTSEALARLQLNTSHPEFDVWLGGPAESYVGAARAGLFEPISDLPAVRSLPEQLRDPEGHWAGVYGGILALCVNTELVAPEDIPASWQELLDERYRGGVLAPNPLLSGTDATLLWVQYSRLGGVDPAMSYMRDLEGQLQGYVDSGTDVARNVARGGAEVGISFAPYCEAEQAAGYPVLVTYPQEGTGYEIGAIALLSNSSHPALAREFIDFAVSPPGQRISSGVLFQQATSSQLHPNLLEELDQLEVSLVPGDLAEASLVRPELIEAWARQVRNGVY